MSVESQSEQPGNKMGGSQPLTPQPQPSSSSQLATLNPQPSFNPPPSSGLTHVVLAWAFVLVAALSLAFHLQSFLDDKKFDGVLVSSGMRDSLRAALPRGRPLLDVLVPAVLACTAVWLAAATLFSLMSWSSWLVMLWRWGTRFIWFWALGAYELLADAGTLLWPGHSAAWMAIVVNGLPFVHIVVWGGFAAGAAALMLAGDRAAQVRRALAHPATIWIAAAVYAAVFSTLSILQYRALMVPHGDTAMYEEHLWNLLHGKGFRSQLDGGRLFLGEHLEVIHLLLLPIYVLLPSLPTLNVCLSVGLGSGAIAVRGIARRLTGSDSTANWLAAAYLLYFPLQYLNLEASLKTFRPENLGVPLLLFAIWALEAGRFRTMLALLGLTLLAKEDYAIPVGMLGFFLAVRRATPAPSRTSRWLGLAILVGSIAYLWFVLAMFIPHFRGSPPHYVAYYPAELGQSPTEIVSNAVRDPRLVVRYVATPNNLIFVLLFLVSLAGVPLLGLGRLWLLAPTLVTLLLLQLPDAQSPFFHFHAPLVPVIFWAAAEGLGRLRIAHCGLRIANNDGDDARIAKPRSAIRSPQRSMARFVAGCALASGVFYGKSPISLGFFDDHARLRAYWRSLYIPTGPDQIRVQSFTQLLPRIPTDARVAATDYIRPRFTHHRECHQYGEGGLKPHIAPHAVDFIVVDLWGPYSNPVQGVRLKELEEEPERWSIFYADPFFLVVRRRDPTDDATGPPPSRVDPEPSAP